MYDSWWRQMARGTICVAGLMSACTAPGRGVQVRVPAAVTPAGTALNTVPPNAPTAPPRRLPLPAQPRSSPM